MARGPSQTGWKPRAAVKPWPGRIRCPASTEPNTATAPAASTSAASRIALASTACRLGIAVSVTRIMPELYSLLTVSTARIATTAWPN
ncbi:MAG TPA: hypothetical protein VF933_03285 [Streptosporangiaceae bacterium]